MKVFISYALADQDVAKDLTAALTAEGLDVWDPHVETGAGENIWRHVDRALQESDAMVILLSPDAVASDWTRREWEYALGDSRFEGKVVPVLVRPMKSVPWILRKLGLVRLYRSTRKGTDTVLGRLRELAEPAPLLPARRAGGV